MTDAFSGTRRYLALWFPFLPADRLRIQEPDRCAGSPDAPLVLFTRAGKALRLAAVDAAAQRLGLAAGMTLADARARFPGLIASEHDEAADRHWLERMARDCIRFAPQVSLVPPGGIGIDITGAAHLFGGEQAMADQAIDRFTALGMTVQGACGVTLEAAQALARHARWPVADEAAALRALPVQALGLEDEATHGLLRAGLKTVGAAAARPMAVIAARFGMAAVRAIERLTGQEQAPVMALVPRGSLRFERRFADPVAHQDAVAASLAAMLHEAARVMEERGLGGRRFHLALFRSDGAVHHLDIATSAPTRDCASGLRLFDERIGALADPLDPGFGYDSLQLTVPVAEPLLPGQAAFDDAGGDDPVTSETAVAQLIDRLSTRLGPDCVRRLVPRESHIPEQAQLALPAIESRPPACWPSAPPGEPPLRPLFLFDPPQRIEAIAEVPDGPPHRFRWRRKLHEVRLYEGPERIAAEWWRRMGGEHDGRGGLTRDYYRVEDARGRRFWLFRHGLYAEKPDPRWYLHGLFA